MKPDAATSLEQLLRAYQEHQGENLVANTLLARQVGLNPVDLRVLLFLRRQGSATPKDVANIIDYASASVTAIIDRLTDGGYVERTPHPTDRRSTVLKLTANGVVTVTQTRVFYEGAFSSLTGAEQRAASVVLAGLTDAVRAFRQSL